MKYVVRSGAKEYKESEDMRTTWTIGTVAAGIWVIMAWSVFAHCDTASGPVIPEARAALEKGDATPVLKWVKKGDEAEVKSAFAQAVEVRAKGPEAQELADQYFIETLVRLHRTGEGAPYTGIKDEPLKPIVAMADKALADGSVDEMVKKMSGHMAEAIGEKFAKVLKAKKHKDESVEAGREFVEAYVIYMHYVEGIRTAIMSGGARSAEAGAGAAEHKD
jgi:hypothetical protein